MQLITINRRHARLISQFGSRGSRSLCPGSGTGLAHFYALYFEPDGLIGPHVAGFDQLFLVISGSGWVRGARGPRRAVRAGRGAYFRSGELHSKGSGRNGMLAIMVQMKHMRRTTKRLR